MGSTRLASIGLDIGSNSVGSAWVDAQTGEIAVGVGVFPAGVEEEDNKRGAPKNQKRREKRSQRRGTRRRAGRKRQLCRRLVRGGFMPASAADRKAWKEMDPWQLRRDGLKRVLTPYEFGRVLLHLAQRRGAIGITKPVQDEATGGKDKETKRKGRAGKGEQGDDRDPAAAEEGKIATAIENVRKAMGACRAKTFGQFIADLRDERGHLVLTGRGAPRRNQKGEVRYCDPVRNRRDLLVEHTDQAFHADRDLIRDEFEKLWAEQKDFGGELAGLLTDEFKKELDNPQKTDEWRHQGLLFGQRPTRWDLGTLGRCECEPSDRCVSRADRHFQEFHVVETVNNLRIEEPGQPPRPLTDEERQTAIRLMRTSPKGL